MRPQCGKQHGGNRKSQGALARLCEIPKISISPPKSKNPITPIKTSRDTLHPGTGATTRTNRPAGRVRGFTLPPLRRFPSLDEGGLGKGNREFVECRREIATVRCVCNAGLHHCNG